MGASIKWQPVEGRVVTPGFRSRFVGALGLSDGDREFTEADIPFLKGVAAGEPDFLAAIEELTDAIWTHKTIRVWAEY